MGMPREGGQVARFGQELLPLTIYTPSLATRTEPSLRLFAVNLDKDEHWFIYVYLL